MCYTPLSIDFNTIYNLAQNLRTYEPMKKNTSKILKTQ